MSIIIARSRVRLRGPEGAAAQGNPPGEPATFLDLLPKLIPVEIVVSYGVLITLIGSSTVAAPTILIAFAIMTPLALWLQGLRVQQVPAVPQYVVRTAAFLAWAFHTSNPLAPHPPVPNWVVALGATAIGLLGALLLEKPRASNT